VPPIGPTKIGKYDVEERVGEGAMGVVYRALDPVLKRTVAIKVMGEAFAQNADLRERFLREAQAAGSLQHPNVITIYDFGEVDGHLYIAMEFVEGQDVAELLAHQVPLSTVAKLDIAIGVLQGLAFAHKRGVVHRDIKPANIRVDAEGNARIMDFGVAHLASSNMTRTGVMIGTPSYMAPEQITSGVVGPQSDIFSVGAVLYELLTGTSPFAGGSLQAVMYRVLSETPAPLGTTAPGLPAKLNDVVARALAKEPSGRYSTALDMANDLLAVRAALEARPSAPGTLSLRATIDSALDERRTSTFRRVRRRRFAMGGGGVVAGGVLVLAGFLLARRGATSRAPVVDTPRASQPVTVAGAQTANPIASAPSADKPKESEPAQTSSARSAAPSAAAPKSVKPSPDAHQQPDSSRRPGRAGTGATSPQTQTQASAPQGALPSTPQNALQTARPNVTPAGSPQPVLQPPVIAPTTGGTGSVASSVASPGVGNSNNASPPSAASANSAETSAEINAVVDAYARAIESRDVAELRRVYGSITADQASAFGEFFKSTRTLRAALAAKSVRVDGTRATAHITGTYEITTTAGRTQTQAVAFDAELRRESGGWKLVAIR
jgi:serine/threonine-protein kinase